MSKHTPTVAYPYCASCGAPELTLTRPLAACARCCVSFYCSKECQQNDWVDHEYACNRLVASRCDDDDDISYFWLDDDLASSVGSPEPPQQPSTHEPRRRNGVGALLSNDYSKSNAHEASSITANGLLTGPLSHASSSSELEDQVFDDSDLEGSSTAPSSPESYVAATPLHNRRNVKPMREECLRSLLGEGFTHPVDPFVDDSLTAANDESSVRRARVC